MSEIASWLPLLSRSIVVGLLGGAGLVLTHMYSRRGPMIYTVYAAILAALAFVAARFEGLPYLAQLVGVLAGMLVATTIAFAAVLHSAARQRRALRASGRPFVDGGAPWWGMPSIGLAIVASSAAVAWIAT